MPIEQDGVWFRSKGEIYSFIKNGEVRARALKYTLPDRLWAGLLCRVLFREEEAEFSWVRRRRAAQVPDGSARHGRSVSAHSLPPLSWIEEVTRDAAATAHQSEVSAPFHTRDSGLKGQVQGLCMIYTMCK